MVKFARRPLELCIAFFALYAFIFVPLGERTGFQHLKAILSTEEAQRAGVDLKNAGSRMLGELLAFHNDNYRGEPVVPDLDEAPDLAEQHD